MVCLRLETSAGDDKEADWWARLRRSGKGPRDYVGEKGEVLLNAVLPSDSDFDPSVCCRAATQCVVYSKAVPL